MALMVERDTEVSGKDGHMRVGGGWAECNQAGDAWNLRRYGVGEQDIRGFEFPITISLVDLIGLNIGQPAHGPAKGVNRITWALPAKRRCQRNICLLQGM